MLEGLEKEKEKRSSALSKVEKELEEAKTKV